MFTKLLLDRNLPRVLYDVDTSVFPWTVCSLILTKTSSVFSFQPHPPDRDSVLTDLRGGKQAEYPDGIL